MTAKRSPVSDRVYKNARNLAFRRLAWWRTLQASRDLEQSRGAHAAADAHRDDDVFHAAALPLYQGVADEPRAAHPVGMADRDRAAVDVELFIVDAEPVAAIDHLYGESLVQFPEADVVDAEAMRLQQFGYGEHRADAHFVGLAACDRDAAIDPERREIALFREPRLHQYAGAGAVRQLRSVASGDEATGGAELSAAREHRLQRGETGQRRVGAIAFVLPELDFLVADCGGRLVHDFHDARERYDFRIEASRRLRGGCALLRLQRIGVLRLARDAVALRDDFGGLQHRHVERVAMRHEPWVGRAEAVHMVVLHQRDRLEASADSDVHAVRDDLLGGDRDRHQAGRALAIDRHSRYAGRQPGAQRALPRDVEAGRTLLQGGAHDHVVDLAPGYAGAAERDLDRVAAERLRRRIVEGAAIGLADRGSRCGDDDGFAHERLLSGKGDAHALGGGGEFECLRVRVLERNGTRAIGDFREASGDLFRRPFGFRQEDARGFLDMRDGEDAAARAHDGAGGRALADQEQHGGRHRFRRQQRGDLGWQQARGHACRRGGREHVDADIVFGPFQVQHVHEPDHRRFGRAVVRLAEIAVDARRRGSEHDAAVAAVAHAAPDRLRADRRTHQMHANDLFEIGDLHLREGLVAQDAGVVDENVDAAPLGLSPRNHCRDLVGVGDVGAVGHGGSAGPFDLLDDSSRGVGGRGAPAEIIDDHLRAPRGEAERMTAPQPASGASDDRDAVVETNAHRPAVSLPSRPPIQARCPARPDGARGKGADAVVSSRSVNVLW